MIFTYQVFHLAVNSLKRVRAMVHEILFRHTICRSQYVNLAIDDLLTKIALLDVAQYIGFQRVKRFQLFTFVHQHDMISCRRYERLAHLSRLQGICLVLKLFQGLTRTYPWQHAAHTCRTVILRDSLRQLGKVSSRLQRTIY